jgi:hypothetical protein
MFAPRGRRLLLASYLGGRLSPVLGVRPLGLSSGGARFELDAGQTLRVAMPRCWAAVG